MKAKKILEALQSGYLLPGVCRFTNGKSLADDFDRELPCYHLVSGDFNPKADYFMIDIRVAAVVERALRGVPCCIIHWIGEDYYCFEIED